MEAPDRLYVEYIIGYHHGFPMNDRRKSVSDVEYIRADLHRAEVDALHAECDRLTAMVGRDHQCSWHTNGGDDTWQTGCGDTYCYDGQISEVFQFCPYCGGKIRIEE